ncbi:hypothetical protein SESBI_30107 [Sesbania bispinosa]|nr:hypothetical protein SESBI_30107 [Sesbania bispinosa]
MLEGGEGGWEEGEEKGRVEDMVVVKKGVTMVGMMDTTYSDERGNVVAGIMSAKGKGYGWCTTIPPSPTVFFIYRMGETKVGRGERGNGGLRGGDGVVEADVSGGGEMG